MFRAAFHTGYIPQLVQRLPRSQCDGANSDGRFHHDFFVDLIFGPVTTTTKEKNHQQKGGGGDGGGALPNKFWNEISKRKERLRRAATEVQKSAVAANGVVLPGTPRGAVMKKRTIIDLHSPMRQRRIAEEKEKHERERRSSSLSTLVNVVNVVNVGGGGGGGGGGGSGGSGVRQTALSSGIESDDVQVSVTSKIGPSSAAFSMLDEEEDGMDSPPVTKKKKKKKKKDEDEDEDREMELDADLLTTMEFADNLLAEEADKSVDELALLEAELGLEGENSISNSLRNFGKIEEKKEQKEDISPAPIVAISTETPPASSSDKETAAVNVDTATDLPSALEQPVTTLPITNDLDDLENFNFDDLSAELEGMGVDDGDAGLDDNTSLEDLDDFLAGLES